LRVLSNRWICGQRSDAHSDTPYLPGTVDKGSNWLYLLGLAFVMAVSVYVILDIEYPRLGFIRVDSFDQALVELRESMM
jgi:hypothetical protein